ncbi:MAG: hypothetical protein ACYCTE_13615, partial [Acidimicrobiales bacterium]
GTCLAAFCGRSCMILETRPSLRGICGPFDRDPSVAHLDTPARRHSVDVIHAGRIEDLLAALRIEAAGTPA